MNKILSWQKCNIYVQKEGTNTWRKLEASAEGSTKINVTKGDKKEAKIEGGEVEAVIYASNKYTLETEIRIGAETDPDMGFGFKDGICNDRYGVRVVPTNPRAKAIQIDSAVVSSEESYSSDEGIKVKLTFDALKPTTGNILKIVANPDAGRS